MKNLFKFLFLPALLVTYFYTKWSWVLYILGLSYGLTILVLAVGLFAMYKTGQVLKVPKLSMLDKFTSFIYIPSTFVFYLYYNQFVLATMLVVSTGLAAVILAISEC